MIYKNYHDNPRVNKLLKIILENPGFQFNDIVKSSGFANGIISHYLVRMEKHGMISIRRSKRRTWLFPPHTSKVEASMIISLRKETSKIILSLLLVKRKSTFSEILSETKRSSATISITLSSLIDLNLIRVTPGIIRKYELVDRDLTLKTVQKIHPSIFEKMKDHFADTFSYF